LSDTTHDIIKAFELNTVRMRDRDGVEGVGYTYICGRNGAAIHAVLTNDLPDQLIGKGADLIEELWQKVWWGQHHGGRGGSAASAVWGHRGDLWQRPAIGGGLPQ